MRGGSGGRAGAQPGREQRPQMGPGRPDRPGYGQSWPPGPGTTGVVGVRRRPGAPGGKEAPSGTTRAGTSCRTARLRRARGPGARAAVSTADTGRRRRPQAGSPAPAAAVAQLHGALTAQVAATTGVGRPELGVLELHPGADPAAVVVKEISEAGLVRSLGQGTGSVEDRPPCRWPVPGSGEGHLDGPGRASLVVVGLDQPAGPGQTAMTRLTPDAVGAW